MNATAQNPLNPPVFEIPDPTKEFGQDGGKFYRCYDALADEIDEDMVKGLKEQLDGMLIFAGLFAGVNTAFLALTLPLLSADPADDTNALLAQNNAILIHLVTGGNGSVPLNSALPSAEFSPSGNIFAINALFSLSLAFAIISSFLAVLGRQWLVYYRKRSGGGPDRERWEQLKRYLGAERWRLEPILDDVLPSLLQIGLIIFCVSLLLYLHHLSPPISSLVGIPLYVSLGFFIGSALCTIRDSFCPFHSPLSHMLFWSARKIPSALGTVKRLKWDQISSFSLKPLLDVLTHGRVEESLESLEVIALQRAICTSDDPLTHISATANIFGITTVAQMEKLWSDRAFRERFLDQLRNSYSRGLQVRGQDQVNFATALQRLYCAAVTHCILLLDIGWYNLPLLDFKAAVRAVQETSILLPSLQILNSPACLIRSTLAFSILQFYTYYPTPETINSFCNYLVICSRGQKHQDWKFLCVLSFIVSNIPDLARLGLDTIDPFRKAYRGDAEQATVTLRKAFEVLVGPESTNRPEFDDILINMLQYVDQMITGAHTHIERKFTLLEICEPVLQSSRAPKAARASIRQIRLDLAQIWERECEVRVTKGRIPTSLLDMLNHYFQKVRTTYQTDLECDESVTLLQTFGPPTRKLFSHEPFDWNERTVIREKRKGFRGMFNEFVMEVDALSHRSQVRTSSVGDILYFLTLPLRIKRGVLEIRTSVGVIGKSSQRRSGICILFPPTPVIPTGKKIAGFRDPAPFLGTKEKLFSWTTSCPILRAPY